MRSKKPIEVELWYSNIYSLYESRFDIQQYAIMLKIFQDNKQVVFKPRTFVFNGQGWSKDRKEKNCIQNGKYCLDVPQDLTKSKSTDKNANTDLSSPNALIQQTFREKCTH